MRKADNLSPSCAVVTKSGNLNLLEPSGPLQACNTFTFSFNYDRNINKNSLVKHKLHFLTFVTGAKHEEGKDGRNG